MIKYQLKDLELVNAKFVNNNTESSLNNDDDDDNVIVKKLSIWELKAINTIVKNDGIKVASEINNQIET